jgi:hypothetical protein
MANIRVSAVSITVDKKILEAYQEYITTANETVRQDKQRFLESAMAEVYGARRISGNPPLIPDYFIEPESLITGIAPFFEREKSGRLNIEAKFQRKGSESKTATTIGGRVSGEVVPQIQRKLKDFAPGDDLYSYMTKQLKISSGAALFDFIKTNAPRFHDEVYQKAKNLTIFSQSAGSVLAYQIYFPKSKFVSGIFGTSIAADQTSGSFSFSYYLNNSFEKSLIKSVQTSITKTSIEEFRNLTYDKVTRQKIRYGAGSKDTKAAQTINIYWPQTNSIPVARIKTRIPKQKDSSKQQESLLDITKFVQGRVRLRMRRGSGTPQPPKIYERTGTFRDSIDVQEFRPSDRVISYFYLPYYDGLERYGYEIQNLVEGSIRAIAQERLGRQFILRKSSNSFNKKILFAN